MFNIYGYIAASYFMKSTAAMLPRGNSQATNVVLGSVDKNANGYCECCHVHASTWAYQGHDKALMTDWHNHGSIRM